MTRIFIVLLLCLSVFCSEAKERLVFPKKQLTRADGQELMGYLKEAFPELGVQGLQLVPVWVKSTPLATYHTFGALFEGVPVVNATVKVCVDLQGRLMSVKYECPDWTALALAGREEQLLPWGDTPHTASILQHYPYHQAIKESSVKWLPLEGTFKAVLEVKAWNQQLDRTDYLLPNGDIVLSYDHMRRYRKDTVISAQIFNPDPLTKLGLVYGGGFVDLADAQQPWIAPAYETVNIPAVYDTNLHVFILENQWVRIEDFEAPDIDSATSATPNFFFDRSQSGFEDCNVLYHISFFQDYIASIGYDTLMDVQLSVDAHGQFGADNSYFLRNGGNPLASFGTGGVDDAEDADVIIHEYCHGISWSANGNGNFTAERSGLDEGLADYFATSYSRTINPFGWEKVFSWDGHNEYWSGRIANTTAMYPSGGNIYAVGELWNSAMSGIWADFGPIVTDKLMLEALHFFTDSTTLTEAARYVMQADTLLFGGAHGYLLCVHFSNRGILPGNCAPSGLVSAEQTAGIRVAQSLEFARGEAPLQVLFDEGASGEYRVLDMNGKICLADTFAGKLQLALAPSELNQGVYVLQVRNEKGFFQTRISRW